MIYLDNAATSFPKPKAVSLECYKCLREYCGNPGRSSHSLALKAAQKIYECREEAASLFNSAHPENVVFTYNTTYALNIAINAFARDNSHILMSCLDHNSVLRPVYALEKRGISHSIFNALGDDDTVIANILSQLKHNTRLLICSHVSNVCSKILPIKRIYEICKERGIIFIVDAAQSAGINELDIKYADAICAPGHKGLYGPQGTGLLVLSDKYGDLCKKLPTMISGGGGINSLDGTMPEFLPERFEAGTLNTPGIAGLCEGIKAVKSIGLEQISHHESFLGNRLRYMLSNSNEYTLYAPDVDYGGTVLFNKNGVSPNTVTERLNFAGICVRSGFHCSPLAHKYLGTGENGAVRVSFGIYNNSKELELLWKQLSFIN